MIKDVDTAGIISDYGSGMSIETICCKYHIGKIRIKDILQSNNIVLRKKNEPRIKRNFIINDWRIHKYQPIEGYHYVAKAKDGGFETLDYENRAGILTTYIMNKYGVKSPTLYDRRIYYQTTGNYWWEQWFDIIPCANEQVKRCPYCNWETTDLDNKSGAFEVHLKSVHNLTIDEHIKNYPEDISYFKKHQKKIAREEILMDDENFVICPICNKKYEKLTKSHLLTHGLDFQEFKKRYPEVNIVSKKMYQQTMNAQTLGNLAVSKNRFISKYEREIREFLDKNNVQYDSNRQMLIGKEIDILINDRKIGIEFNGLKWHTEWFGKKEHKYHLQKTIDCNKNGYGLIHIFEDEYVEHRDIVFKKISHILKLDNDLPRVMGRKCTIKEIYKYDAEVFLTKFHIQGYVSSSVYLGCFHNDKLVAVMTFKNGNIKNPCWELTRFATDYNYRYQGVGSKMFSYFVKKYTPTKVISFADRRWTVDMNNNLYIRLGFTIDKICPPDYRYYLDESKNDYKYKRIHKMSLNKKTLSKKYGFPLTMTETEMARELGYDRIWDCGLIKYVWVNER